MSVQLINQLFENHFNINGNRNERILGMGASGDISSIGDSSLSDGTEKRELKKYKAVFIHYTGEEDNGMDSEDIQAYSYDEAYSKACKMPGRVYKVTEL